MENNKNYVRRNLYVYNSYGNTVIISANSVYEAYGLLISKKDENNNRMYYPEFDEVKQIPDAYIMTTEDCRIIEPKNV